jgi:hypothetical protein
MRRQILVWTSALLALFSCARKEQAPEEPFHTIPYSVWVSESPDSRATLAGGNYVFEAEDLLYVSGIGENADKLYGYLNLVSGVGETQAHYEGSLFCADDFTATASTPVTLALVGPKDQLYHPAGGKLGSPVYPENGYAESLADAVEKFSCFTGSGAFGDETFNLSQQTAFLTLNVKMNPAEAPVGSSVSISLTNGGDASPMWQVTRTVESAGQVSQCIPFEGGAVTLDHAKITAVWGDNQQYSREFTDVCAERSKTLARNNYYNLTRLTIEFKGFRIVASQGNTTVTFNYCGDGIQYSDDLGFSWHDYDAVAPLTLAHAGDMLCFKGRKASYDNSDGSTPLFHADKLCYIAGNIMSLLPDENVLPEYAFCKAFSYSTGAQEPPAVTWVDINPEDPLLLPVTTLNYGCYYEMFRRCTSLTWAPDLMAEDILDVRTGPANNQLARGPYYGIFRQCSSLQRIVLNGTAFKGGEYVQANYDRDLMKYTFDKWMYLSSNTGTIYAHPDMVTYWQNARSSGGWYSKEAQFATIGTGWTVVSMENL